MSRKAKETTAPPWLDALEQKAHGAVERLAALAAENRRLMARIEELEATADGAADGDAEPADWRRERAEIRQRVRRLTATLDRLSQGEIAD